MDPTGPITVVTGKKRRLTFFECGNDLNSMIDCAKISDLILLVIDGHFGFEMVCNLNSWEGQTVLPSLECRKPSSS